jgi:MOSC domain-containing protein YiiM
VNAPTKSDETNIRKKVFWYARSGWYVRADVLKVGDVGLSDSVELVSLDGGYYFVRGWTLLAIMNAEKLGYPATHLKGS